MSRRSHDQIDDNEEDDYNTTPDPRRGHRGTHTSSPRTPGSPFTRLRLEDGEASPKSPRFAFPNPSGRQGSPSTQFKFPAPVGRQQSPLIERQQSPLTERLQVPPSHAPSFPFDHQAGGGAVSQSSSDSYTGTPTTSRRKGPNKLGLTLDLNTTPTSSLGSSRLGMRRKRPGNLNLGLQPDQENTDQPLGSPRASGQGLDIPPSQSSSFGARKKRPANLNLSILQGEERGEDVQASSTAAPQSPGFRKKRPAGLGLNLFPDPSQSQASSTAPQSPGFRKKRPAGLGLNLGALPMSDLSSATSSNENCGLSGLAARRKKGPPLSLSIPGKKGPPSLSLPGAAALSGASPPTSSSRPSATSITSLESSLEVLQDELESGTVTDGFKKLSRNHPDMTEYIANQPDNSDKNRYRDISPYDQTRVVVRQGVRGDYINANYVNMTIPGTGVMNRYLAAQGPLPHTCAQFWQMVWEQQSSLIVMLTSCVEGWTDKCHKYWPEVGETSGTGEMNTVTCAKEDRFPSHIYRELTLHHTGSGEKRNVQHLQYLAWPDHGVPEEHGEFVDFVRKVRRLKEGMAAPVVVHCSAGIGRTGVFITMDTAMCTIQANRPVIPLVIVGQMRDQRAGMIQTSGQYKFVCEAILKVASKGRI